MIIKIEKVTKKFKKVVVVDNANLELESGKIYGFIGRNGSGKSVLLKMICGFYQPTSGKILFDGRDIIGEKSFAPDTRALIERPSFLPYLTGFENLLMLAKIQDKIGEDEIRKILEKVNLSDEMDKKYSHYSLGMKQKLGIAQVLMENPQVMLFDEPFNGIDKDSVKKIREILIKEKNKGKLIVLASHLSEDIEIADIVYEFDNGKVSCLKNNLM